MEKSKTEKRHGGEPRTGWWWSFGNHPVNSFTMFTVTVLGFIIGLLGFIYAVFGPFNLLPKTEPPVTAQDQAYAAIAREAMKDGAALLDLSTEPPHLRDKFQGPDYINLRRHVADGLQQVRESEPPERFRALHADVILFLEKAEESATIMSRYSYSLDYDTLNRAAEASEEARRAMNRVTAELNQITRKLHKES